MSEDRNLVTFTLRGQNEAYIILREGYSFGDSYRKEMSISVLGPPTSQKQVAIIVSEPYSEGVISSVERSLLAIGDSNDLAEQVKKTALKHAQKLTDEVNSSNSGLRAILIDETIPQPAQSPLQMKILI